MQAGDGSGDGPGSAKQDARAESEAGARTERVGVRGSDLVNCLILDPLILPFSATAPCVALPPTSLSASLREKGRRVCTAGVEFHVLAWLITCKAAHSERLTDGSTDLYGTAVVLVTIAIILLIFRVLGLVSSYTLGGPIHNFLVVAVVMIAINPIQARRV